ncbi:MAG TPA: PqqD family protein [Patescibacteria group bacterium]|nr:PqqD family protein [Patescibacteria group bacterium]
MKYKINKGLINQVVGGKMTIFDGENSLLHTFSESGSFIFKKIRIGADDQDIIDMLVKRYGIKRAIAEKDFYEFVNELLLKGIISK